MGKYETDMKNLRKLIVDWRRNIKEDATISTEDIIGWCKLAYSMGVKNGK